MTQPSDEVPELIVPFCTKEWAEKFCSEYGFTDYWDGSSDEKKISALKTATDLIRNYVTFFDEKMRPFVYEPDGTDDWENKVIPRLLKQATTQEAVYLLSLDDNPAEPHPLTILGLIEADRKKFDKQYVPPVFPISVIRLLTLLNGDIDPSAVNGDKMQVKSLTTSY